jgi:hypothetical protein
MNAQNAQSNLEEDSTQNGKPKNKGNHKTTEFEMRPLFFPVFHLSPPLSAVEG